MAKASEANIKEISNKRVFLHNCGCEKDKQILVSGFID